MTTAATRLVVLLGHPVAHSLSPRLHSAAFAATGIDAVYVACDVAPAQLPAAVAGVRALGALGANATVPHKTALLDLVDACTAEAALVGAANTLFWDGERLVADNTDAAALASVLRDDVGLAAGEAVLIFGAGGAARAVAVAAGRLGAAVAVDARRPAAAAEVAELARRAGGVAAAAPDPSRARLVVNATPLGLYGEALPDPYLRLQAGQTALDLTYAPEGVHQPPFLAAAEAGGAVTLDGRGMLIEQAAAAFSRWTGRPAPRTVMRTALLGHPT